MGRRGLNPYSYGMRIEQLKLFLQWGQYACLNPYSYGMRIELTKACFVKKIVVS